VNPVRDARLQAIGKLLRLRRGTPAMMGVGPGDRRNDQRNAIHQPMHGRRTPRFRGGPGSAARNRVGAARPVQGAEETT
jgi:hypothetical protein